MSRSRRHLVLAGIVIATAAVYAPNLTHPFVYDDENKIQEDTRLRDPLGYLRAFDPSKYKEETTRLIPNLTFSLNYKISELKPFGYNLTNLLIHLVNIWLVARLGRVVSRRFGARGILVPLLGAGIFALHPLQTEAVNYCNARPNTLCTTFYLLTLLVFLRVLNAGSPSRWMLLGFVFLATLLCKEIGVTIALMILVLGIWKPPAPRHMGSLATGFLITGIAGLFITGAYNEVLRRMQGGSFFRILHQAEVLLAYFGLEILPLPSLLTVDHDFHPSRLATLLSCIGVAVLLATAIFSRARFPFASFFLLWPLITHAPTSLVPGGEPMVEYRTYLPMAGVSLLLAWIVGTRPAAGATILVLLAIGTLFRNPVWRSPVALWEDAAAKTPDNERAVYAHGVALYDSGKRDEAEGKFRKALGLRQNYGEAHLNLGILLGEKARLDESLLHIREAVRLEPKLGKAHYNLGVILSMREDMEGAAAAFEKSLEVRGGYVDALVALAGIRARQGRLQEASNRFEEVIRLEPRIPLAHHNWGATLEAMGRQDEALARFVDAARLKPDYLDAHMSAGQIYLRKAQWREAEAHFRAALQIRADRADARLKLGIALAEQGRLADALHHLSEAIRLNPADEGAKRLLQKVKDNLEKKGPP